VDIVELGSPKYRTKSFIPCGIFVGNETVNLSTGLWIAQVEKRGIDAGLNKRLSKIEVGTPVDDPPESGRALAFGCRPGTLGLLLCNAHREKRCPKAPLCYCGSGPLRKQLGLSKVELARRLGISRQSLYRCIWDGPPKVVALAILGGVVPRSDGRIAGGSGRTGRTINAKTKRQTGESPIE
jgi:Helix-turn-helix